MRCRDVKIDRLVKLLNENLYAVWKLRFELFVQSSIFWKTDCLIHLKIDYLIRLFNLRCCENPFQLSAFRVQTMSISQSLFSHSASTLLFENVWKSSFRFLIQFRFKFLQSSFRRKRCTEIFHVLNRVNDSVHVKINFHWFVFWHSLEIWLWIIFRECWVEINYFRKFYQCLSRSRKLRVLKLRQFHSAIAKLR